MKIFFTFLSLPFVIAAVVAPTRAVKAVPPKVIQIGVIKSSLVDVSEKAQKAVLGPLGEVVQNATGRTCQTKSIADPMEIGRQLESGKLHFAGLNGHEFAWVQEKFPKIKPLVITQVGQEPSPMAYLVALKTSLLAGVADLKGKAVVLPEKSRPHVRFFLQRESENPKGSPFSIRREASIMDALDDIILGKVDSVAVDGVALKNYGLIKPGCLKRLKIVHESVAFPAGVLVYREGVLSPKTLTRFRNDLLTAHRNKKNRVLMDLFQIRSFGAVPGNYSDSVRRIRKVYPRLAANK